MSQGSVGMSQGNVGMSHGSVGMSQGNVGMYQGSVGTCMYQGSVGMSECRQRTCDPTAQHINLHVVYNRHEQNVIQYKWWSWER